MKKFLEDLENELQKKNLTATEIEEILADHEEMIRTALDEGLDADKIIEQFGEPKKVAEDIVDVDDEKTVTENAQKADTKKSSESLATFAVGEGPVDFHIELTNDDATFKTAEGDTLRVSARGKVDLDDYTLTFQDNKFVLTSPKKSGFNFLSFGKKHADFLIEVPEGLEIRTFYHKSLNGDVVMERFQAKSFELSTVNGDLKLQNVAFGETKLHTVNGDFTIKDLEADSCRVSLVSGDMKIEKASVKEDFHISTVSGDVLIENAKSAGCILHSVSGDIEGREFYPDRVALKSVSGDIVLKNKEEKDIRVESKKTVSGRIKI